jgi:hypothetical protein
MMIVPVLCIAHSQPRNSRRTARMPSTFSRPAPTSGYPLTAAAVGTRFRGMQTLIAINAVLAERVDEFEEWLRTVVVPATRNLRPDLDDRWKVLRATEADDGTVVFAFVYEGGAPEDWELRPYLENALGSAGADRELHRFESMLRGDQRAWAFETVGLDGP